MAWFGSETTNDGAETIANITDITTDESETKDQETTAATKDVKIKEANHNKKPTEPTPKPVNNETKTETVTEVDDILNAKMKSWPNFGAGILDSDSEKNEFMS